MRKKWEVPHFRNSKLLLQSFHKLNNCYHKINNNSFTPLQQTQHHTLTKKHYLMIPHPFPLSLVLSVLYLCVVKKVHSIITIITRCFFTSWLTTIKSPTYPDKNSRSSRPQKINVSLCTCPCCCLFFLQRVVSFVKSVVLSLWNGTATTNKLIFKVLTAKIQQMTLWIFEAILSKEGLPNKIS